MNHGAVGNILANALQDDDIVRSVRRRLATPRGLPKGGEFNVYRDKVRSLLGKSSGLVAARVREMPYEEAVISEFVRPSLLVRNDRFEMPESEVWRVRLNRNRRSIESALPSAGRLELPNSQRYPWIGTGWLVSDDVVVTNRHVARIFAYERGGAYAMDVNAMGQPLVVRCDFREEYNIPGDEEFPVVRVKHIEPMGKEFPDLAFLIVARGPGLPPPIELQDRLPEDGFIGVIGYPQRDPRNGDAAMTHVYGDIYEVKRFSPGKVVDFDSDIIFAHDCSTLGGNSGSPVIDLSTGAAVGLHFGGIFREANFAVKASVVKERMAALNIGVPVDGGEPAGYVLPPSGDLRLGYQPDFLGTEHEVPLPEPRAALKRKLFVFDGDADAPWEVRYIHYSLAFHAERRLAAFTACNLNGAETQRLARTADPWAYDKRVPRELQAGNDLYRKNMLNRGHLVRRLSTMWGTTREFVRHAERDTYWWTNCVPRHEDLDESIWLALEDHILNRADVTNIRLSVFSGPVLADDDPFYRREYRIPKAFWKIVAFLDRERNALRALAFLLRQDHLLANFEFSEGHHATFQTTVSDIERRTGLKFGPLARADAMRSLHSLGPRPLHGLDDVLI
ncbi:MAG: DNA/RNA non-specific endonuclease [Alphaproteobacteria bacterium]